MRPSRFWPSITPTATTRMPRSSSSSVRSERPLSSRSTLVTTRATLDFMRTRGNRWRLAIIVSVGIISQYSGNAVISNYMNLIYAGAGITDQNQKLGVSQSILFRDLVAPSVRGHLLSRIFRSPPERPFWISRAPLEPPSWLIASDVARCS